MVEWYLPILSVMVNIALNAFRHIISGIFREFTPHANIDGSFFGCCLVQYLSLQTEWGGFFPLKMVEAEDLI